MSITFHEASVAPMSRGLRQLAKILDKAAAHYRAQGSNPDELVEARLAPDMFPLRGQVQSASDAAKACAARLAGLPPPSFPDTESTFDELQARIARTIEFIESIEADQINSAADRPISMKARGRELTFTAPSYLFNFALPNFYFHVTTAYDICRHKGVVIGKMDYLGEL